MGGCAKALNWPDKRLFEMSERQKVKIKVLKRFSPSEVFEKSPAPHVNPNLGACELFTDGQEFVVDQDLKMPDGFCGSAWQTIWNYLRVLVFGGNFPWFKEKGVCIVCCADGLRPVIFKLERI